MGGKVWWNCGLLIIAVVLALSCCEEPREVVLALSCCKEPREEVRVSQWKKKRACDEMYVVGEGETLQSISEKCGDPFIVEHNPHIHDADDVFPGLVIKITPFSNSIR
ncbi:hypothetical protein V6N13_010349 [Hibiscus sabdariffa]|uniref:LysM domain-containing protein n=2 Tax=Hibiscus sabdariffa TaxID=183260 RepID=A0ABR2APJ1_9ROSI